MDQPAQQVAIAKRSRPSKQDVEDEELAVFLLASTFAKNKIVTSNGDVKCVPMQYVLEEQLRKKHRPNGKYSEYVTDVLRKAFICIAQDNGSVRAAKPTLEQKEMIAVRTGLSPVSDVKKMLA